MHVCTCGYYVPTHTHRTGNTPGDQKRQIFALLKVVYWLALAFIAFALLQCRRIAALLLTANSKFIELQQARYTLNAPVTTIIIIILRAVQ